MPSADRSAAPVTVEVDLGSDRTISEVDLYPRVGDVSVLDDALGEDEDGLSRH
jgi:hypothetical protein